MFSDSMKRFAIYLLLSVAGFFLVSCASERRIAGIRSGGMRPDLSIPSDLDFEKMKEELLRQAELDTVVAEDNDGPLIMNAIKDQESGEMVATDVIRASRVVARFRNIAERFGKVNLEFDITVPQEMLSSSWKLELSPLMKMLGDSTYLDPVYITGQKYRDEQMRGYRRYARFLSSIIGDSADFVRIRQLEIFIERHFPETYAMKNDSSFVSDPHAENIFGVSRREALEHYTKHYLVRRNDRRIADKDRKFRKYVKDPIVTDGLRLDTVLTTADGEVVYRYVQQVGSRPGLKRIDVALEGRLYEDGEEICQVARPEDIVFYVSSLSSLADPAPRYMVKVLERRVYDNTHAFIDFAQGKADVDTLLPGNSAELSRIRKCIDGVVARDELVLDSLIVTASCSPEGGYSYNSRLSMARSEAVKTLLSGMLDENNAAKLRTGSIPENWERLCRMAKEDTVLSEASIAEIERASCMEDKDRAETAVLAMLPEYRYLREKIYPRLRTVKFDFYLHRKGMEKDTVHTTALDTVYMHGVEALRNLDYKKAVELLRPYKDYNSALAFLSAGYDHSALDNLEKIKESSARTDYLMAVVLSRLERKREAKEYYLRSVDKDPSMAFRANLDPELADIAAGLDVHNQF